MVLRSDTHGGRSKTYKANAVTSSYTISIHALKQLLFLGMIGLEYSAAN